MISEEGRAQEIKASWELQIEGMSTYIGANPPLRPRLRYFSRRDRRPSPTSED